MLRSKRGHCNEKPTHHNGELLQLTTTRGSPRASKKTQHRQKKKKKNLVQFCLKYIQFHIKTFLLFCKIRKITLTTVSLACSVFCTSLCNSTTACNCYKYLKLCTNIYIYIFLINLFIDFWLHWVFVSA